MSPLWLRYIFPRHLPCSMSSHLAGGSAISLGRIRRMQPYVWMNDTLTTTTIRKVLMKISVAPVSQAGGLRKGPMHVALGFPWSEVLNKFKTVFCLPGMKLSCDLHFGHMVVFSQPQLCNVGDISLIHQFFWNLGFEGEQYLYLLMKRERTK